MAGAVSDVARSCQGVEVSLLDVYRLANFSPLPVSRQVQTREGPDFDFFPGVLSEESTAHSELSFDLIQPSLPTLNTVTVDAKYEEVHHTSMLIDDFSDAFRSKGFVDTLNRRV